MKLFEYHSVNGRFVSDSSIFWGGRNSKALKKIGAPISGCTLLEEKESSIFCFFFWWGKFQLYSGNKDYLFSLCPLCLVWEVMRVMFHGIPQNCLWGIKLFLWHVWNEYRNLLIYVYVEDKIFVRLCSKFTRYFLFS